MIGDHNTVTILSLAATRGDVESPKAIAGGGLAGGLLPSPAHLQAG